MRKPHRSLRLKAGILPASLVLLLPRAQAAEEFRICAGIAPMANIFSKIADAFEKSSGIRLKFTSEAKGNSTPACLKDVDEDKAQAACNAVVWTDLPKVAKDANLTLKHDLTTFENQVIGRDRIQILTYPGAPKKLSMDQIKMIFTGKTKNWKDLGGEDRAIVLVHSENQPTGLKFLQERYFNGEAITKENMKVIPKDVSIDGMPKLIATTPGAIGFGPINFARDGVVVPEHPEIGRPITCFQRGGFGPQMKALMAFIKKEGKTYDIAQ